MEKILLTIKEVCELTGIGKTKAREIITGDNDFSIKIGNKWYVNKNMFIEYINKCMKYRIDI